LGVPKPPAWLLHHTQKLWSKILTAFIFTLTVIDDREARGISVLNVQSFVEQIDKETVTATNNETTRYIRRSAVATLLPGLDIDIRIQCLICELPHVFYGACSGAIVVQWEWHVTKAHGTQ
jgi:hypothetical protein